MCVVSNICLAILFAEGRARRVARHVASGTRYELRAAGPGRAGPDRTGGGGRRPAAERCRSYSGDYVFNQNQIELIGWRCTLLVKTLPDIFLFYFNILMHENNSQKCY